MLKKLNGLVLIALLFFQLCASITVYATSFGPVRAITKFDVFMRTEEVYLDIYVDLGDLGRGIERGEVIRDGNNFSASLGMWTTEVSGIPNTTILEYKLGKLQAGDYKFAITTPNHGENYKYADVGFDFKIPLLQAAESANNKDIKVSIDDIVQELENKPVILDDRVLIPVRSIFERFEFDVRWDEAYKTITLYDDNTKTTIKLYIGQKKCQINNRELLLDVAPQIIDESTFIPVRFICESINKRVDWNDFNREVQIFDQKKPQTLVNFDQEKTNNNIMLRSGSILYNLFNNYIYFIGKEGNLYRTNLNLSKAELIDSEKMSNIFYVDDEEVIYNFISDKEQKILIDPASNGKYILIQKKFTTNVRQSVNLWEYLKSLKEKTYYNIDFLNLNNKQLNFYGDHYKDSELMHDFFNINLKNFKPQIVSNNVSNNQVSPSAIFDDWLLSESSLTNIKTNTSGKLPYIGYATLVDKEWVYFPDSFRTLARVKTDGTSRTRLTDKSVVFEDVNDGWIYLIEEFHYKKTLFKMKTDLSQKIKLADFDDKINESGPNGKIGVIGNYFYYFEGNEEIKILYKTDINTGETVKLEL